MILTARVVSVHDGDTITVVDAENHQHKIRLAGIDAPELGQPFGRVAKHALADRVGGQTVTIEWKSKDRYGRLLGDVRLAECWINREMVESGLAWQFVRYDRSESLFRAEFDAIEAERGVWSTPDRVPPWAWRKPQSMRQHALP